MNYNEIYNNFKDNSVNCTEEQDTPFFILSNDNEREVIAAPYSICMKNSLVWSKEDLNELKKINVPAQLIQFYSQLNPCNVPMNNAGISLLSLKKIQDEYTKLAPSAYLIKFGFLTIATTIGGNPIIIDLHSPSVCVYIVNYNFLYDSGAPNCPILEFTDISDELFQEYGDDVIEVSHKTIKKNAKKIEDSFERFIWKLSMNQYGSTTTDLESLLDV